MKAPSSEIELMQRQLQREKLSRQVTENILEKKSLELYSAHQSTQHLLLSNELMMEQYNFAVNTSALVTKSDPHGLITYVNKAFEKVSGYSKAEILGKPHSVFRHPDMPSWVFKDLWHKIHGKEIWQGLIKNRKKDGSHYYVDTTIKPILNVEGEIVEFIAIRHDVTELIDLHEELEETQKEIILTLSELGESRSKETGQHVRRVAEYSYRLSILYGLDAEEALLIKSASPMHDIGKISIPDSILLKPGKLTVDEFEIMKTHAQRGHDVFAKSERPLLKAASVIALQHHEKWDGTGYPSGLTGNAIHLYGRITAIADVFDALVSKRVYKDAWSYEDVSQYFLEQRGKHFDPDLVDLFLKNCEEFIDIFERFED